MRLCHTPDFLHPSERRHKRDRPQYRSTASAAISCCDRQINSGPTRGRVVARRLIALMYKPQVEASHTGFIFDTGIGNYTSHITDDFARRFADWMHSSTGTRLVLPLTPEQDSPLRLGSVVRGGLENQLFLSSNHFKARRRIPGKASNGRDQRRAR